MATIEQAESEWGELLAERNRLREELTEIERVMAVTITQDPEVITVPGDLDPRVKRGVEWLDINIPGWASKLDLDRFDIRHTSKCVLGQIYGEFGHGVNRWFPQDMGYTRTRKHGFLWKKGEERHGEDAAVLQDSWVRAIKFRQAHA